MLCVASILLQNTTHESDTLGMAGGYFI